MARPSSWDTDLPDPPRREIPTRPELLVKNSEIPRISSRQQRSDWMYRPSPESETHPYYGAAPADTTHPDLDWLDELLEQLPEPERTAVRLYYFDRLSLQKAAEEMGLKYSNQAKRARDRGLDLLRALIEDHTHMGERNDSTESETNDARMAAHPPVEATATDAPTDGNPPKEGGTDAAHLA